MASAVRGLDPRLKMLLGLVFGVLAWHARSPGVALLAAFFLALVAILVRLAPSGRLIGMRTIVLFALFWAAAKLGLDLLAGADPAGAAEAAALLGGRLLAVAMIGLAIPLAAPVRELGLALAWALRPVLGRNVWKTALSLALMLHFLPMIISSFAQIRDAIAYRCPTMPWRRKLVLLPRALLRNLGVKTWEQTLAVASRGLDRPEAWTGKFSFGWRDLVGGLCGAALGATVMAL